MFNLFLENNGGGGGLGIILIVVLLVGMLVFSSISNKKKQKQAAEMVNTLKKGDRVKTIGGICGFVVEIYDAENTFVLETGTENNKSYIKFDKAAIYQTAPKEGYANPKPKTEKVETAEVKTEETVAETPVKTEVVETTDKVEDSLEAKND